MAICQRSKTNSLRVFFNGAQVLVPWRRCLMVAVGCCDGEFDEPFVAIDRKLLNQFPNELNTVSTCMICPDAPCIEY